MAAAAVAATESTAWAEEAVPAGEVAPRLFFRSMRVDRTAKEQRPHYHLLRAIFPCYSELIYAETCLALVPGGTGDSGFDL